MGNISFGGGPAMAAVAAAGTVAVHTGAVAAITTVAVAAAPVIATVAVISAIGLGLKHLLKEEPKKEK